MMFIVNGIDEARAGWLHEGCAADLVRELKYGRITARVTPIVDRLASVTPGLCADLVTWVPCSPSRRRGRGFDPAELLARALARRLRLKAVPSLRRLDDQPQTSRSRQGRLQGPQLSPRRHFDSVAMMVVDDVSTTGSTLRAAAATLRAAGAVSVVAIVATVSAQGEPEEVFVSAGAPAGSGVGFEHRFIHDMAPVVDRSQVVDDDDALAAAGATAAGDAASTMGWRHR